MTSTEIRQAARDRLAEIAREKAANAAKDAALDAERIELSRMLGELGPTANPPTPAPMPYPVPTTVPVPWYPPFDMWVRPTPIVTLPTTVTAKPYWQIDPHGTTITYRADPLRMTGCAPSLPVGETVTITTRGVVFS